MKEFHSHPKTKDGKQSFCKTCRNEIRQEKYKENPEKDWLYRQTEAYRISQEKYRSKLRLETKKRKMEYLNSAEYAQKIKEREEKKRLYHSKYVIKRCQTDINYKLRARLRQRLSLALKSKAKVGSAVNDIGCPITEFKSYLESKFKEGMSWENYGKWEIDHIKPLSSFDLTKRDEFVQAAHFSNLQPLWKKENQEKGCVVDKNIFSL